MSRPAGPAQEAARLLGLALLKENLPGAARLLAGAISRLEDPGVRQGALAALQQISAGEQVDEVWAAWAETRHPELENYLQSTSRPAAFPPALAVLSDLLLGQVDRLASAGPQVVEYLLEAGEDANGRIANAARQVLLSLENAQAREEVCRRVIESGHPLAVEIALQAGYSPVEPRRRALFFLLTGQWEKYEQLDFDASLLATVYETADERLRSQIAQAARQSGWGGFVDALAGQRLSRRMGELQEVEWEVLLAILGRGQRYEELWQLAQAAPVPWSARMLKDLLQAGWQPADPEACSAYTGLAASACKALDLGLPTGGLVRERPVLAGHTRLVTHFLFIPQHGLLASASADTLVQLWDLAAGSPVRKLFGHSSFVLCLAVSPDGSWLASGSADRTVRLWRLPSGEPAGVLSGHAGEITSLAFSPDGATLASADAKSVRLWSLPEGAFARAIKGGASALAIRPQGDWLLSAGESKTLLLHPVREAGDGKAIMETVLSWSLLPDGESLVTGSNYGTIRQWALPGGELLRSLHGRTDGQIVIALPGERVAASDRKTVRLWQLPGEEAAAVLEGHAGRITALAGSPGGHPGMQNGWLASAADDLTIRLWPLPGGEPATILDGLAAPASRLVFSPAGDLLAAADGSWVRLWNLDSLDRLLHVPSRQISLESETWAQGLLQTLDLTAAIQAWISFALQLAHWRRRHDIEVEEAPLRLLSVGEYDIEIEG